MTNEQKIAAIKAELAKTLPALTAEESSRASELVLHILSADIMPAELGEAAE